MRRVAIVQARLGSTRLPGKVLMDLAGRTILDHVLSRCAAIPGIAEVVCATTDRPEDDAVAKAARGYGATVFCGSSSDVLARYDGAAKASGAELVLRVTSDCPLIDPEICGALLDLAERERADFASNNTPPASFAHGFDCEAFTAAFLARAVAEATEQHQREHVGPWMRYHPHARRADLRGPGVGLAYRLTIDYQQDLDMMRRLFEVLPDTACGWREVVACLDVHPEIAAMNSGKHAR
jgi:spore coat polysaccharide biosynthesis protein SpsF (cytidylyltransferase family)